MHTVLKSSKREVSIGTDQPFVMIGEKINPTGNKKLAAALQEGNLEFVRLLAQRQVAWGADMLDVNVGVPGMDEAALMPQIIELVTSSVDVPVCLDSANPDALASGLRAVQGKALVNSVSGEEKRLQALLPLVKEHGAAMIGLTIDDKGIPTTIEERVAIAGKILERAAKAGIPPEDVIIDPLVMTVSSDSTAGLLTLQTIELIRREFGVNINLGASNISFGLPDRPTVNQAFLAMAIQAGATCSITDPIKLGATIRAADLLLGRDEFAMKFIKYFRTTQGLREKEAQA